MNLKWGVQPARMTAYPLPLRDGVIATLRLPDNLMAAEAERIAEYVRTLVSPNPSPPPDAPKEKL